MKDEQIILNPITTPEYPDRIEARRYVDDEDGFYGFDYVFLEDATWHALCEIANEKGCTVGQLCSHIDLNFAPGEQSGAEHGATIQARRDRCRVLKHAASCSASDGPNQAAGLILAAFGIKTRFVANGSSSLSQTSRKASARALIRRSLWKGVGVMRSRSLPRGTVG